MPYSSNPKLNNWILLFLSTLTIHNSAALVIFAVRELATTGDSEIIMQLAEYTNNINPEEVSLRFVTRNGLRYSFGQVPGSSVVGPTSCGDSDVFEPGEFDKFQCIQDLYAFLSANEISAPRLIERGFYSGQTGEQFTLTITIDEQGGVSIHEEAIFTKDIPGLGEREVVATMLSYIEPGPEGELGEGLPRVTRYRAEARDWTGNRYVSLIYDYKDPEYYEFAPPYVEQYPAQETKELFRAGLEALSYTRREGGAFTEWLGQEMGLSAENLREPVVVPPLEGWSGA
ncbi:MAG: hypothetical protein ACOCXP_02295 [Candidatus Dojkabacteria bacterium]